MAKSKSKKLTDPTEIRKAKAAQILMQYARGIDARAKRSAASASLMSKAVQGLGKFNFLKSSGKFMKGASMLALQAGAAKLAQSGSGLYTSPSGIGRYRRPRGRGAYETESLGNSNNLVSGAGESYGTVPLMRSSPRDETGTITITHREYLSDIYGPGTAASGIATPFANQTFAANPGLQQSFPFASQIAMNFCEYEFMQLIYEYRSVTTDVGNSTTGQCGTVIMAFNYNAAEGPFTDKQSMMEYAHAASCKVTENLTYGVECDPRKRAGSDSLYITASPIVPLQDIKSYNWGVMNVALANLPPAYNGLPVGELWVYYKFFLRKPRLYASRGLDIDADIFYTNAARTTLGAATPFGAASNTSFLRGQQNSIGCLLTPQANGYTVTFPAAFNGNVRVSCAITGTVLTAYTATPVSNGNIVFIQDQYGALGAATAFVPGGQNGLINAAGTALFISWDFYVTQSSNGVNNTIFFSAVTAATVTATSLRIDAYQSMGSVGSPINLATSRPNFVDVNGVVVVPV